MLSRGWFAIYRKESLGRRWSAPVLGALCALVTVVLDLKVVFPPDLNVRFPASLLFYPAIGFVVDIVFHVLPLAVLLFTLTTLWKGIDTRRATVGCMVVVGLLEPVYQTLAMAASPHFPAWSVDFVRMHLFLFNLLQLWMFQRYDFLAMYATRLGYYLVWHVVWGELRLGILF